MGQIEQSTVDSVVVEPAFDAWKQALESPKHTEHAAGDRALLGIATDRPVVMSGHQPAVFYPGIVAKLAALMHSAEQTGACPVWIVPDQDVVDPFVLRIPLGCGEDLQVNDVRIAGEVPALIPACSLGPTTDFVRDIPVQLEGLVERLHAYSFEETLARQCGHAIVELACAWLGVDMPTVVFASDLAATASFGALADAMHADPLACVQAYNRAAAMFPEAGVRALVIDGDRVELPLWRVQAGRVRQRVFADELGEIPCEERMPRGLLMTAVARSALCELFIHGTGGWAYDQVTEEWMRFWRDTELPPMAHVTATQRLDLGGNEAMLDPARASWEAHHARHTPAMVGDADAAAAKAKIVEQIKDHQRAGTDPFPAYAALHALLQRYRAANSEALRALEQQAAQAKVHRRAFELANDRTWAFVLFDEKCGQALMDRVRAAMG